MSLPHPASQVIRVGSVGERRLAHCGPASTRRVPSRAPQRDLEKEEAAETAGIDFDPGAVGDGVDREAASARAPVTGAEEAVLRPEWGQAVLAENAAYLLACTIRVARVDRRELGQWQIVNIHRGKRHGSSSAKAWLQRGRSIDRAGAAGERIQPARHLSLHGRDAACVRRIAVPPCLLQPW